MRISVSAVRSLFALISDRAGGYVARCLFLVVAGRNLPAVCWAATTCWRSLVVRCTVTSGDQTGRSGTADADGRCPVGRSVSVRAVATTTRRLTVVVVSRLDFPVSATSVWPNNMLPGLTGACFACPYWPAADIRRYVVVFLLFFDNVSSPFEGIVKLIWRLWT